MMNKNKAIEQIKGDFEVIAETAIKQITLLKDAVTDKTADIEAINSEINRNEMIVDTFELKINEKAIDSIVLYNPLAGDLRYIISCMRVASNLERISDLAQNIIGFVIRMENKEVTHLFSDSLEVMLEYTKRMVKNSLLSFSVEDIELAEQTIKSDDEIDDLLVDISKKIMISVNDPDYNSKINSLICLNNIVYNVERIADNATNIAEAAIYMLKGKDIRHSGNPQTN